MARNRPSFSRAEEKSNGTFVNFPRLSFFLILFYFPSHERRACSLDAKYPKSVIARNKLTTQRFTIPPIYYFEISYIVRIIFRSRTIKERGNVFYLADVQLCGSASRSFAPWNNYDIVEEILQGVAMVFVAEHRKGRSGREVDKPTYSEPDVIMWPL